jgi:hypothetical protein
MALLTLGGAAEDKEVVVPELDALKKVYDAQIASAGVPHQAAVAELEKKYVARLAQEQEVAQKGGKLDEALAIEAEKKAVTPGSGMPLQQDAKTPPALRKMRATYRAEIAKLELARIKKIQPLRDDYSKKLEALMTGLTKEGKLQEAMAVKRCRESLTAISAAPAATPAAGAQKLSANEVMSVNLPGGILMKFCYCPPGSFLMGSPSSEKDRRGNEDQVKVQLSKAFWMAQTECTQAQWTAVMGGNPSRLLKGDDLPVANVNWSDAQKFITKLNEAKTLPAGWKVAMPTEAQWEYACRAGTKTAFGFGRNLDPKQANFANT